ncbi:tail fiber protein [Methylomonas sp. AM2-LC]|uniref:phage tail protein n=1 Tax=Methylomonas sp. AM2-LC TaxID=3153301 RepID=UPI0032677334
MADPFLGEIRIFSGNFAPVGWFLCDGTILPISQYTALFAIIGTTYGGNGVSNFALPDLRGRFPIGQGSGPGLSPVIWGESSGQESVTLLANQMPSHNHQLTASSSAGTTDNPLNAILANGSGSSIYATGSAPNETLAPTTITNAGGNTPIPIRNPHLGITFIIAYTGIFPSRA